jgi:DNA (cytosine-5)-methyltransferase 1
MKSDFTCVDCFSGAGGLALGLGMAGVKVIFSFDNDPRCIETQRLNSKYFNHEAGLASIENMLGGVLLKKINMKPGQLFLMAGGPPCQGFSVQRSGQDEDLRNNLIIKYMELIGEVRPQYFLMENVPGITGKRGLTLLNQALSRAKQFGYYIHQDILDAQDYGVPQRRKRVFIIGERISDDSLPKFKFPVPKNSKKITVRKVIGSLPSPPEDGSDHHEIVHHRRDKLSDLNKRRLRALAPGQGRDQLPEELLAKCHLMSSEKIGHRNVYGRMDWDDVSPTITARFDSFTRGKFGHPEELRSISLREGALIQTFPIGFIFSGNKVDIARQIGNAVPVLLAKAIGEKLMESSKKVFDKGEG